MRNGGRSPFKRDAVSNFKLENVHGKRQTFKFGRCRPTSLTSKVAVIRGALVPVVSSNEGRRSTPSPRADSSTLTTTTSGCVVGEGPDVSVSRRGCSPSSRRGAAARSRTRTRSPRCRRSLAASAPAGRVARRKPSGIYVFRRLEAPCRGRTRRSCRPDATRAAARSPWRLNRPPTRANPREHFSRGALGGSSAGAGTPWVPLPLGLLL